MNESVATTAGSFTVHSEAHGPHWMAWLTRGQETRPVRDVVLIGETRDEAEGRARRWVEEAGTLGYLSLLGQSTE